MSAAGSLWLRFADKVLPTLFVGVVFAVGGGLWANYTAVSAMVVKQKAQDEQIAALRADMALLRDGMVTRKELADTIAAMGQRFEIAMLRSGLRPDSVRIGQP